MLPIDDRLDYTIPPYDLDALAIEVELLLDWYAPHVAHVTLTSGAKATFTNLWRHALRDIVNAAATWTLRDYHSPNLLWLPQRASFARIGMLDFQDCVLGHPAYDVVSLLQDARTDVADAMELRLLGLYAQLRQAGGERFDMTGFATAYAILGAQRATKILGIFARLDKRDQEARLSRAPAADRKIFGEEPGASAVVGAARLVSDASAVAAGRRRHGLRLVTSVMSDPYRQSLSCPIKPWCSRQGSEPACVRSPRRFRSRSSQSPASR